MSKKAVFMDRDGTINQDVGYPHTYSSIKIFPYSFDAVKKINQAGLLAVIISNQSGVGRGIIKELNLQKIHQKMCSVFAQYQAKIDGIYYCPHYPLASNPKYKQECLCRKPQPGLALQASNELNIDLPRSYMIGDKVEDILLGLNIQATPILVLTGYGKQSLSQLQEKGISPAWVAPNLLYAVNWILDREKKLIS